MSPRGRTRPDRSLEKALLETYDCVGGLDEVGRGALAGPVSVGLAIVARRTDDDFPEGLADSKQLTARARTVLIEPVRGWLVDHAVAHASPAEIDEHGIVGALRVAGLRALQQVADRGHAPGVIILDGVADWLTAPQPDLLTTLESTYAPRTVPSPLRFPPPRRCAWRSRPTPGAPSSPRPVSWPRSNATASWPISMIPATAGPPTRAMPHRPTSGDSPPWGPVTSIDAAGTCPAWTSATADGAA